MFIQKAIDLENIEQVDLALLLQRLSRLVQLGNSLNFILQKRSASVNFPAFAQE